MKSCVVGSEMCFRDSLKAALTDDINSREVYIKGIDHSYYYEGYANFKTEELSL